jgi:hypothetical protein
MALCCLAQLFCLEKRIGFKDDCPLLSVRDIVELPACRRITSRARRAPRKGRPAHGAWRARHRARKKDIERRKRLSNLTK